MILNQITFISFHDWYTSLLFLSFFILFFKRINVFILLYNSFHFCSISTQYIFCHNILRNVDYIFRFFLSSSCVCVWSVCVSKRGNTNRHVWMKSCWKYAERIENNRGNSLSNNSKVRARRRGIRTW